MKRQVRGHADRRRPDRRYRNRQRIYRRHSDQRAFQRAPFLLSVQEACRAFVPRLPREYVGEPHANGRIVTIPQYSGHMLRSEFRLVNIDKPYNRETRSNPLLLKKRGHTDPGHAE